MLDKLLTFLESKNPLNDVLCGYFAKVMTVLLTKFPFKILKYLYTIKLSSIENFIFHSYQYSISELTAKILTIEGYIFSNSNEYKEEYKNAIQMRNEIILKLFKSINLNEDNIYNKVCLIENIIESKSILEEITSNVNIVNEMISKLSFEISDNKRNSELFKANYAKMLQLIISIVQNCTQHKVNIPISEHIENGDNNSIQTKHSPFSQHLVNNLEIILSNYKQQKCDNLIETAFGDKIKPLGIINMKLIELVSLLFSYFKSIPLILDNILIKSNFFKQSLEFLFEYQWNNLFQQSFIAMFKQFINDEISHKILSRYIFFEIRLTNQLIDQITNNSYKFNNSNTEIRNGYFSLLIYLCYKINTIGGGKFVNVRSREGSFYFVTKPSNYLAMNQHGPRSEISLSLEIKSCLNDEWDVFFKQNVSMFVRLYETRLCDEQLYFEEDDEIVDASDDEIVTLKEENEDNVIKGSEMQPKGMLFFKEIEEDMDITQKQSEINIELNKVNVQVDEVDLKNYNDINYWKEMIGKNEKFDDDIMNELGLN